MHTVAAASHTKAEALRPYRRLFLLAESTQAGVLRMGGTERDILARCSLSTECTVAATGWQWLPSARAGLDYDAGVPDTAAHSTMTV